MDIIKKFNKLTENVKTAQTNIDQATGSLAEVKKSLKGKFKVNTLKQAKEKLEELETEEAEKKEDLETAIEDFEEKWENDE